MKQPHGIVISHEVRGPVLSLAASISRVHANHSPLRGFWMLVDMAFERTDADLSNTVSLERTDAELSNTVSTTAWKQHSDEYFACKRKLKSAGLRSGPLGWETLVSSE